MPRAALFPTGFAANLGVLTTFGAPDVLVCSDELNHASIIDGCRLSTRRRRGLPARRPRPPRRACSRERGDRRALVVSDTVFSMDGDVADVDALVAVAARHDALLVLDEAHAVLGRPSTRRPTPTCCGSARCRRRSGRSAGSSPARRATSSSSRTPRGRTSSPPRRRRPTPRPRSPALAGPALARRRRARGSPARARRPAAARASVADHPVRLRRRSARARTRPPRCSTAACSCPRSGRRRSRRAPPGCGSRCRPRTPTHRSTGSSTRSPQVFGVAPRRGDRPRRRDRHRGRQDVGHGGDSAALRGRGATDPVR